MRAQYRVICPHVSIGIPRVDGRPGIDAVVHAPVPDELCAKSAAETPIHARHGPAAPGPLLALRCVQETLDPPSVHPL